MKTRNYLTIALCMAFFAACTESQVFYSTSYPVVRIEPEVLPKDLVIPPATEGEETTTEDNPIVAVINADILANAPVQPGGKYTLDFTEYNGGPLHVNTATDAGVVKGGFFKGPGADSLWFIYGQQSYICKINSDNTGKAVLTVDLTEYYQELHPAAAITKVLRKEFTSANRK